MKVINKSIVESGCTCLKFIINTIEHYHILSLRRSARSQTFFEIGVLKNFTNFKFPATLLKRDSNIPIQLFSCNICEIFKTPFFYNTLPVASSASGISAVVFEHVKHIITVLLSFYCLLWTIKLHSSNFTAILENFLSLKRVQNILYNDKK